MRQMGLEPIRLTAQEPKSCLSANSNTGAENKNQNKKMRHGGIEPPTT